MGERRCCRLLNKMCHWVLCTPTHKQHRKHFPPFSYAEEEEEEEGEDAAAAAVLSRFLFPVFFARPTGVSSSRGFEK